MQFFVGESSIMLGFLGKFCGVYCSMEKFLTGSYIRVPSTSSTSAKLLVMLVIDSEMLTEFFTIPTCIFSTNQFTFEFR